MKAEYKNCPKCHIINAPTATRCECGYKFTDGEVLSDEDISRMNRAAKKRNFLLTLPIVLLIALFIALSMKFGFLIVLVYSIGFVIVLLLLFYIISRIKSKIDRKRLED